MIIGTVPYLNVQPIVWPLERGLIGEGVKLVTEVPSKLADLLAGRQCDTAIVSVFEYFRRPDFYTYLQAPVIAACGEVYSVMMYSSEPWEQLRRVYLDASSLTSVNLFKVLSAEKGLELDYLDTAEHQVPYPLPRQTGWVVIGDPAMAEAGQHPYSLDLALAWNNMMNLPFVFAAWLVPEGIHTPGIGALLNRSLGLSLSKLEQVARDSAERFGVSPEFALLYFTRYINYHFGEAELAGWISFGELCYKHGLIKQSPVLRQYCEILS